MNEEHVVITLAKYDFIQKELQTLKEKVEAYEKDTCVTVETYNGKNVLRATNAKGVKSFIEAAYRQNPEIFEELGIISGWNKPSL